MSSLKDRKSQDNRKAIETQPSHGLYDADTLLMQIYTIQKSNT